MDNEGTLFALQSPSEILWTYRGKYRRASSPILGVDGTTVYFTADDHLLFAIDNHGRVKWELDIEQELFSGDPILTPDGNIYIRTHESFPPFIDSVLYGVSSDGVRLPAPSPLSENLGRGAFDSNGNFYVWNGEGFGIYSSTGENTNNCQKGGAGNLMSDLLIIPGGAAIYALSDGWMIATNPDCSVRWKFPIERDKNRVAPHPLTYDGDKTLYVGGIKGTVYAFDIETENLLWESDPDSGIGDITSLAVMDNGLVYAASERGKIAAYDFRGAQKWSQTMYRVGSPGKLQKLSSDEFFVINGGQLLAYTRDPSLRFDFPPEAPSLSSEEQIKNEIISFLIDDYVGRRYLPNASLFVYYDADKPVKAWRYENNQRIEADDAQKAIDDYHAMYIKNRDGMWNLTSFSIIGASLDYQSAEVEMSIYCGMLCGSEYRYYLQRSGSGDWWIYKNLLLRIS
jgi:outer membrane protein assembly factor BamB